MLEESEEMGERVWGNKRKNRRKVRKKILPQEDLFTNYSSVKLTPAMKSVLNKGKTFVLDRTHCNLVDMSAGVQRMTRDMRWDEFFQKQAKDSEDEEDTSEEVDGDNEMEERVLKDRVRKCNLPRGHRPPQAQLDFESANRLNLLSPRNLKKISLNSTEQQRAALKDLVTLQRERVLVIKPADKNPGLTLMDFADYDKAVRAKLSENFTADDGTEKQKYPPSSNKQLKKEFKEIEKLVLEGLAKGFIGEKDAVAAMPAEPKAGRLYANPKDHKPVQPRSGIPGMSVWGPFART